MSGLGNPTPFPWGRVNAVLALLIVVVSGFVFVTEARVSAARAWLTEQVGTGALPAASGEASPPQVPVAPAPNLPAPASETIGALATRVGVVTEPRALLLARAWGARAQGTADRLDQAIIAAERAVVRLPADAESLALLAELYAEAGRAPELRRDLAEAARARAPKASTTLAAQAAVAWADGDLPTAHAAALTCLRPQPDEPLCQLWALRTEPAATPIPSQLAAWSALIRRWPGNHAILRDAAVYAARVDADEASERLRAARSVLRDDIPLRVAQAEWAHRHGDDATAATLVRGLGAAAPVPVAADLAAAALARGDADAARSLIDKLDESTLVDTGLMRRVRVLRAQSRYLLAVAQPGENLALAAARASARAATDLDHEGPAAVQVRVLAETLGQDYTTARTALDGVESAAATGRDLARLWLSGVALDVAQGVARSAGPGLDRALAADPRLPEVHLWRARVAIAGEDVGGAFTALDEAILGVDGTDSRRDPAGRLLPVPCPAADIRRGLESLIGSDVTRQARLAKGLAILAWLDGDTPAALARLQAIGSDTFTPDLHALYARLLLDRGDVAAALAAVERAVAADPGRPEWRLVRARVYAATGRHAEALADVTVVKSSGRVGSLALAVEAESRSRTGDIEGARRAAAAAVQADPADRAARELVARLGANP